MKFLKNPVAHIWDSSTTSPSQLEVVVALVEELIALRVLEEALDDDSILANSPLFVLPKIPRKSVSNLWLQQFETEKHDPKLGARRVLLEEDGLGAALIWAHVDDFFIHTPTREKLARALNHFMNLTVEVGMLCSNPAKVVPPSQWLKYYGFEYASISMPTLHVPESKISKALAIIKDVESPKDGRFHD